jgi:hypothetical protein
MHNFSAGATNVMRSGRGTTSEAEYQIHDYVPTFNKGAYRDVSAEQVLETLGTPSASDASSRSSFYGNIGTGADSNRSRIFVRHFPKRVADDDTPSRTVSDYSNIKMQQENFNLQMLIQNTDRSYANSVA